MRKTKLGRTGIEVSPIAFGTRQLGGDWGSPEAV
jgi:aryl-alcohol dehydrogenase-like predicted oxidoreductase